MTGTALWLTCALLLCATAAGGAPADRGAASKPTPRPVAPPDRPELLLQLGHAGSVEALAFSPDGRLLATGGEDWTVRLWEVETRTLLRTWRIDGSHHAHFAFSPDSRKLATQLGQSGSITIRDVTTGKALKSWELGRQSGGIAWSPDGKLLACGSMQNSVALCDAATGKTLRSLRTHGDGLVETLVFSPDSRRLFCGGGPTFGRSPIGEVFNVATGDRAAEIRAGAPVTCAAFSGDGKLLAVGCGGWPEVGDGELWDTESWTRRLILKRDSSGRRDRYDLAAVGFGGGLLFTVDEGGALESWDQQTGKHLRTVGGSVPWHAGAIGPAVAAIAKPGGVQLLDTAGGMVLGILPEQRFRLREVTVTPDGHTLVALGQHERGDKNIAEAVLWDLRTGQWNGGIVWEGIVGAEIVVAPDNRMAAVLEHGGTVALLDLVERRFVRRLRTSAKRETLVRLGFDPEGRRLWVAGMRDIGEHQGFSSGPGKWEGILEVWSGGGKRLLDLSKAVGVAQDAAIPPPGDRLWVLAGTKVWVYDFVRAASRQIALPAEPDGRSGRFSADGSLLAVQTGELVRLWRPRTRRWIGKPVAARGEVQAVSASGQVLAYEYPDRYALGDSRTGRMVALNSLDSVICGAAFFSKGQLLALAQTSGEVQVLDARQHLPRVRLILLPSSASAQQWLALTPGGQYAGSDGAEAVLRWRQAGRVLPGEQLRAAFRSEQAVQVALAGRASPELYQAIQEKAESLAQARNRQLGALTPKPEQEPEPRTPSERLARALSEWGDGGTYEERVRKQLTRVRELLEQGADPNTKGRYYGVTPLMLAARAGDPDLVRGLLRKKVDLNARDTYGSTALHNAAEAESPEIVQLLLDAGAELKDPSGKSLLGLPRAELNRALARALDGEERRNAEGVVQTESSATGWLLLYLGADANTRDAKGNSLLNEAYYPWLLRMLLRKGADPNYRSAEGYPPLVAYAMRSQIEPFQLLLDAGADPNGASKEGWTALTFAAQNGELEIAKLLIDRKASVNRKSSDGRTALHLAIPEHLEIARLLLEHGADPNVKAEGGYTPLGYAVANTDTEAVKLLLKYRANPRVRSPEGKTMLELLRQVDPTDRFGLRKILETAPQP